jgi:hypothetical protein
MLVNTMHETEDDMIEPARAALRTLRRICTVIRSATTAPTPTIVHDSIIGTQGMVNCKFGKWSFNTSRNSSHAVLAQIPSPAGGVGRRDGRRNSGWLPLPQHPPLI